MTPASIRLFQTRRVAAIDQRHAFSKTYVHESAHCVIAHVYGIDTELLRVAMPTAGPDPNGCCRFTRAPMETLALIDELIISEAGGCADEKFSGRDTTGYADVFSMAGPALRFCSGDGAAASAMMLTARRRAAALVDKHWGAIRALADALADHGGVMTQDQIAPYLADIPQIPPAPLPRPAPTRSRPAEITRRPPVEDLRLRGRFVESRGVDGRIFATMIEPATPD